MIAILLPAGDSTLDVPITFHPGRVMIATVVPVMIDGDHHMRAFSVVEQLKERVNMTVTVQNRVRSRGSTASAVSPTWAPA